jgi:hypothetical protein
MAKRKTIPSDIIIGSGRETPHQIHGVVQHPEDHTVSDEMVR